MQTKKDLRDPLYGVEQDIAWLRACVKDNALEGVVYKFCFEDDTWCRKACQYFGWQGGTIHQVIQAIKQN